MSTQSEELSLLVREYAELTVQRKKTTDPAEKKTLQRRISQVDNRIAYFKNRMADRGEFPAVDFIRGGDAFEVEHSYVGPTSGGGFSLGEGCSWNRGCRY